VGTGRTWRGVPAIGMFPRSPGLLYLPYGAFNLYFWLKIRVSLPWMRQLGYDQPFRWDSRRGGGSRQRC
jgi:hypothetical protein